MELNALKGCIKTIVTHKPTIMIEINTDAYKATGCSTNDIVKSFEGLKYEPYEIGKRGRLVKCNSFPTFGNLIYKPA